MKRYQAIAQTYQALLNCEQAKNWEWEAKHDDRLQDLIAGLPRGSGIDIGPSFDYDSTPEKLVFTLQYHHMNDDGMYDGWTQHQITVRPSLVYGLDIKISGRDRNQIKDYIHDVFHAALTEEVES